MKDNDKRWERDKDRVDGRERAEWEEDRAAAAAGEEEEEERCEGGGAAGKQ